MTFKTILKGVFKVWISQTWTHINSLCKKKKKKANLLCRSGVVFRPCGSDCSATLAKSKTSDCSFEKHRTPNILDNSSLGPKTDIKNKTESKKKQNTAGSLLSVFMWTADTEPEHSQAGRHKNNQQRRDVGSEETQDERFQGRGGGGGGGGHESVLITFATVRNQIFDSPLYLKRWCEAQMKNKLQKKRGKSSASNCTKKMWKGIFMVCMLKLFVDQQQLLGDCTRPCEVATSASSLKPLSPLPDGLATEIQATLNRRRH